jgi:hypothetical protein
MKKIVIKSERGFFEVDLLLAIAALAILVAIALPLIAKNRGYWWLIILVVAAIWLLVLYGIGIIGSSRFSSPRPPKQGKTDRDDHVA